MRFKVCLSVGLSGGLSSLTFAGLRFHFMLTDELNYSEQAREQARGAKKNSNDKVNLVSNEERGEDEAKR